MTSCTDETYTTSTTQLVGVWSATDPASTISRYEYAVGASSGGTQVRTWTSAGTATTYTITGLTLSLGSKYYISARAVNALGVTSNPLTSSGVTVARGVASIQEAKTRPNGDLIGLPARVVSAAFSDKFYVQDPNRGSGIRVNLAASYTPGQNVVVFGTMGLNADNNERIILNPYAYAIAGTSGPATKPLVIIGKSIGGSDLVMSGATTPGVTNMLGLNNIGLLVRMCGKVTKGVSDGFYLNDGVGPTDETGYSGIKVWTGTSGVSYENSKLLVTGVVSLRKPGATVPVLLARDIQTL